MTNSRLNQLIMIHIYKEELDEIDVKLLGNKFLDVIQPKITIFGLYQLRAFVCLNLFIASA